VRVRACGEGEIGTGGKSRESFMGFQLFRWSSDVSPIICYMVSKHDTE
jgi:hypothetical protein